MELKAILESLIFASDKPLTLKQLKTITNTTEGELIKTALKEIEVDYQPRGIQLMEVGGGYQFRTNPENASWVKKLLSGKPPRLTQAMLETLAILAYRQPITRPEIEDIRGVDCGGVIRLLLERGLIRIVGKKEEVGRPILYGTTKQFLEFFNLKDLKELPTLKEFTELSEEHAEQVAEETGDTEEKGVETNTLEAPDTNQKPSAMPNQGEETLSTGPAEAEFVGQSPKTEDSSVVTPPVEGSSQDPSLENSPTPPLLGDSEIACQPRNDQADTQQEDEVTPKFPSDLSAENESEEISPSALPQNTWSKPARMIEEEDDDGTLASLDHALDRVDDIMRSHEQAEKERLKAIMEALAGPLEDPQEPEGTASPKSIKTESSKPPLNDEEQSG